MSSLQYFTRGVKPALPQSILQLTDQSLCLGSPMGLSVFVFPRQPPGESRSSRTPPNRVLPRPAGLEATAENFPFRKLQLVDYWFVHLVRKEEKR